MNIIKKSVTTEQIINKSRFISYLFPIDSEEEAKEILQEIRKKHHDATHNCYSYILGDNQEFSKNSDDGEPAQTAGIVIYEVLKRNNLTNVLAIITRYYGGIKLGAGGLVRAYSSSTANAVELAEMERLQKYIILSLEFDYSYLSIINKELETYTIINKVFTEKIFYEVQVPEEDEEKLNSILIDITKNNINIENKK